ncbi:hypothetical protein AAHE18_18G141600 [Arachis hypogaea]
MGKLFALLMVSCMGKALWCIMMRKEKMDYLPDYQTGRYHSLLIEKESFPHKELEVTAWTEDGLIMAARHKKYKHLQGVQFHPESIITTEGKEIVQNFIKLIERKEAGGS